MDDNELRDTLLDLERFGWDSLCDSTGDAFYGQLMTDDGVMVLANGAVLDRTAAVEALGQSPPGVPTTSATTFVGVMSSVYVWAGETWRLALYQQTPCPQPAAVQRRS